MKEIYTKPISEIQEFKTVDVVTTSIENINPGGGSGEGWM